MAADPAPIKRSRHFAAATARMRHRALCEPPAAALQLAARPAIAGAAAPAADYRFCDMILLILAGAAGPGRSQGRARDKDAMKGRKLPAEIVIPAKAGIHPCRLVACAMDARLRGHDGSVSGRSQGAPGEPRTSG